MPVNHQLKFAIGIFVRVLAIEIDIALNIFKGFLLCVKCRSSDISIIIHKPLANTEKIFCRVARNFSQQKVTTFFPRDLKCISPFPNSYVPEGHQRDAEHLKKRPTQ